MTMFVPYDAQAVQLASQHVPAFEAGWYPARATSFGSKVADGGGGPKIEVAFQVWQAPDRSAATRTVKAHFCLQHPKPQARGMFHARLAALGRSAGAFDHTRNGTNVELVIGKWVEVELKKVEGTNRQGEPSFYNNIDDYRPLVRRDPAAPPAPGAGVPTTPAEALPAALSGAAAAFPHGVTGAEQMGADVGYAPADPGPDDIPY